jgi:heat shock protein HslJ
MKKIILLLTAFFAFQSCSQSINPSTISETKWVLSEWTGRTLPTKAQATMNFDGDNKIGGKSFCNSYGGAVTINDNAIKFDQIFSTKMYCDEVSEAENNYLSDLQSVNQAKKNGDKLLLLKDGKLVMVFVRDGG